MSNSLRSRINYFHKSKFVRNVLAVATGVAAAQAISLAFMPFLTRLYGPGAFGALAAFTAIINIITPLATLGYANAIVMPKTEEGANAVARLSLVSAAIVSPITLIIVYVFQSQLATLVGLESESNLLYLIPISLVLVALLSVANQVAIREGLFKLKSGSYVLSNFIINLGKLGAGYISASGITLIVLSIFANLINYIILMARVPKVGSFDFRQWFGITGIRKAAFEHKDFAIYRMPQSVIRAASMGLPVIMLTALFGSNSAGQYSILLLILGAPVVLLGDSVGDVFYPKITRAIVDQTGNAFSLISQAVFTLLLVAAIPFGFIIIFGDTFLPWLLGVEWQLAGKFSPWIALWMIAMLIVRPAVAAMPALKIQSLLLFYEVIVTAARIGALYIGYLSRSEIVSIVLFSLVNVFGYIGLLIFILFKSKR
ncbi:lipopolysaccharide biosynthesis protein [Acinetobacter lwoffii]|uniref:lipopolysaccharide biosynthesis protein n=1 Tax=Acinetobacter lwoffii TaxID=28090 RepID=UPI0011DDF14D|nr:oligosaccharide flippase family protein [Acinetobacter lwoffii]